MSLQSLMVRDVTVVHPGTTVDRYGNVSKDWETATRKSTKGWMARLSADEVLGDREALVSGMSLTIADLKVAVEGGDRVEVGGETYEVDGPPLQAWSPQGPHHLEVTLRRVEG